MTKLTQTASAIALAVAATTAFAWNTAPNQPPFPNQDQQQAMVEQQQAMMDQQQAMIERHDKAMRDEMAARQSFVDQEFAQMRELQARSPVPFAAAPAFPERPAAPEFAQFPSLPEFGQFPGMPEFGQYPAMPEMPAMPSFERPAMPESMQARMKEMDAHRAQIRQQSEERRAAMKQRSEERRAMHGQAYQGRPSFDGAPGMMTMPAPPQQAAAPAEPTVVTQ